jgi:hypothetical protein
MYISLEVRGRSIRDIVFCHQDTRGTRVRDTQGKEQETKMPGKGKTGYVSCADW